MLVKPDALFPIKIFPPVPLDPILPVQPVIVKICPAVQATALLAANVSVWFVPEDKAIVEDAVRFKVDELVQVVVAVIPDVDKVPPFKLTCDAKVAFAEGFNVKVPAVIVVEPVYESPVLVRI